MIIRTLLNLFIIFTIFLFHFTFFQSIIPYFGKINLLLIAIIFITALTTYKKSISWILMFCVLSEIYNFLPFGFSTILLLFSFFFTSFLFFNVFTDRSLYSFLVATLATTFFYEFLFRLLIFFWKGVPFLFIREFWIFYFNIVISNLIVVFLLFYLINFLFNKFNSIFIKEFSLNTRLS